MAKKITKSSKRKKANKAALLNEEKSTLSYQEWLKKHLRNASLFILFASILVTICFVGQSPAGPPVIPDQIAKIRIVAESAFSYQSDILTQRKKEQRAKRIIPIYQVDFSHYASFTEAIQKLDVVIKKYFEEAKQLEESISPKTFREETTEKILSSINLPLNKEDINLLLQQQELDLSNLFNESLLFVKEINRQGIFEEDPNDPTSSTDLSLIKIENNRNSRNRAVSKEEAYNTLRINLSVLEVPAQIWKAFFRIFRNGLENNIVYDKDRNQSHIDSVLSQIEPVTVKIQKGDSIIEPNQLVTPEQYEQLTQYRIALANSANNMFGINTLFWARMLTTLGLLISGLLFLQIISPSTLTTPQHLALIAITLTVNFIIIRSILQLGDTEFFGSQNTLIAILPYMAPVALAPILVALLISPIVGILVAGITCALFTMMLGNSVDTLMSFSFSTFVGIYFCRNIRLRENMVKASLLSGISLAICALLIGLFQGYSTLNITQQMGVALLTSLLTGVIAIGVIPILEKMFTFATDITLLELSDFNHPLLRRMQVEAPGSYHHTLMVANLAESVALQIGANPLICRACSLFHDIGKLVKPEFFTENQKDGHSPHDEKNPSMSALIIKAHIKEGVELAKKHKLPPIVIDVIQQHHGTSLISFFFHKAKQQTQQGTLAFMSGPEDSIEESTYRYDGPKPNFKESAIISLVDSCEAASRSLKKVTQTNVSVLVEQIFQNRIEDGQLDDCPLTLNELAIMKEHIVFSLLNMLHSRIEYPEQNKSNTHAPFRSDDSSNDKKDETVHSDTKSI